MNFKELVENFNEVVENPAFIDRAGFEIHDELNTKFWVKNILKPEIRERLHKIAKEFFENLELENVDILDLTLTGSLANYNWSSHSDADLHIIVDFKQINANEQLVRDYFNAKIALWNQKHSIKIHDFEVEIYVQDDNEPHHATGIYSILNNEWLTMPLKVDPKIDWQNVRDKVFSLMSQINSASKLFKEKKYKEAHDYASKLREKIKKFRRTGLERVGQYSSENIAFKVLRRNEYLGKLASLRISSYDAMRSINGKTMTINIHESVGIWKKFLSKKQ